MKNLFRTVCVVSFVMAAVVAMALPAFAGGFTIMDGDYTQLYPGYPAVQYTDIRRDPTRVQNYTFEAGLQSQSSSSQLDLVPADYYHAEMRVDNGAWMGMVPVHGANGYEHAAKVLNVQKWTSGRHTISFAAHFPEYAADGTHTMVTRTIRVTIRVTN